MKPFLGAIVAIVVISGIAAVVLDGLDMSAESVFSSDRVRM